MTDPKSQRGQASRPAVSQNRRHPRKRRKRGSHPVCVLLGTVAAFHERGLTSGACRSPDALCAGHPATIPLYEGHPRLASDSSAAVEAGAPYETCLKVINIASVPPLPPFDFSLALPRALWLACPSLSSFSTSTRKFPAYSVMVLAFVLAAISYPARTKASVCPPLISSVFPSYGMFSRALRSYGF
jgi:hypothetical protein